MSQLPSFDPDDSLTIDGADLLAEIRAERAAELGQPRLAPGTDPVEQFDPEHTAPTQHRWKPIAATTDEIIDTTGTEKVLSRPQVIAIVLACLLGLGAAAATWRSAGPPVPNPPDAVDTQ